MEDEISEILNSAGYETVSGFDAVKQAIRSEAGEDCIPLCSGYRVFPDGSKCNGCSDCDSKVNGL